MGYLIGAIVLLAIFVISAAIIRKRIYNEVDRLGAWKIEIMNRPVTDEIAKVKSLNMVGAAERKFEQWRNEWEQIVTIKLPDLEEKLFDAEEASDKYQFRKAKTILKETERELEKIEADLNEMLTEVNEWVESDEKNRGDVVSLKETYRQGKQYLLTHYQSFGKAALQLEDAFHKVGTLFDQYEEMTEQGNYLEARRILLETKQLLVDTKEKLDIIPELRMKLRSEIPAKLKDLELGIQEMEEQGYVLDNESLTEEIAAIKKLTAQELKNVEANEVTAPRQNIKEIDDKIDQMYDLLEKEVLAKQAVDKERDALREQLSTLQKAIIELKHETEMVSLSYRIDDKDKQSQKNLEKNIENLLTRFKVVEEAVENQEQTYTSLLEMVDEIKNSMANLNKHNEEYKKMLSNLRKDELEAKETIKTLRKRLFNAKRLIQKYNLPGIPASYVAIVDDSEDKIIEVEEALTGTPLDISAVNYALGKALESVQACMEKTEEMIEQALLTEKLVQYGNRYRSQFVEVHHRLQKAEAAFRRYDYEEALEIAARAIEPIDPDALKKLHIEIEEIEPALTTTK